MDPVAAFAAAEGWRLRRAIVFRRACSFCFFCPMLLG